MSTIPPSEPTSSRPTRSPRRRPAGAPRAVLPRRPAGLQGPRVRYAGGAEGLRADAEAAGVGLYVHAPYIVNVATTNNRIRIPSRKLLQQHMDAAAEIGARGLIVHGGHVNNDDDPAVGFDNWRKAIEATDIKIPLLIENTAGGDNAMARYLDRIKGVFDAIAARRPGSDDVGFCLDTCHAHAGGIPLESVVDEIRAITGRIDLVHCNDSRDEFDSGADRHANVGAGQDRPRPAGLGRPRRRCPGGLRDARVGPTSTSPTSRRSAPGCDRWRCRFHRVRGESDASWPMQRARSIGIGQ